MKEGVEDRAGPITMQGTLRRILEGSTKRTEQSRAYSIFTKTSLILPADIHDNLLHKA